MKNEPYDWTIYYGPIGVYRPGIDGNLWSAVKFESGDFFSNPQTTCAELYQPDFWYWQRWEESDGTYVRPYKINLGTCTAQHQIPPWMHGRVSIGYKAGNNEHGRYVMHTKDTITIP